MSEGGWEIERGRRKEGNEEGKEAGKEAGKRKVGR